MAGDGRVEENERTQGSSDVKIGKEDRVQRVSEVRDNKFGPVGMQLRPLYHNHGRAVKDLGGIKVRVGRKVAVCLVWPMHQNHARNVYAVNGI